MITDATCEICSTLLPPFDADEVHRELCDECCAIEREADQAFIRQEDARGPREEE